MTSAIRLNRIAKYISHLNHRPNLFRATVRSIGKMSTAAEDKVEYDFEVSPIPKNPLGEGAWIKTAGCLIIG